MSGYKFTLHSLVSLHLWRNYFKNGNFLDIWRRAILHQYINNNSQKISLESLPTDYKKSVHVYCGVRTGFHLLEYC